MKSVPQKWKALAAVIALVSLILGWYWTLRPGIFVGDDFYYRVNSEKLARSASDYIVKTGENSYDIRYRQEEKSVQVTSNGSFYSFAFSDGKTVEGNWNGVFLDDGSDFPFEITVSDNGVPAVFSHQAHAITLIHWQEKEFTTISVWYILLLGLLFYVIGVVTIWFPEEMYFLFSRWQYRNAELSDAGKMAEQFGGIMLCGLGILTMTGLFFKFFN